MQRNLDPFCIYLIEKLASVSMPMESNKNYANQPTVGWLGGSESLCIIINTYSVTLVLNRSVALICS